MTTKASGLCDVQLPTDKIASALCCNFVTKISVCESIESLTIAKGNVVCHDSIYRPNFKKAKTIQGEREMYKLKTAKWNYGSIELTRYWLK